MIIAGIYSFNGGKDAVEKRYPTLLKEIETVISAVDAERCKTKVSDEKTSKGQIFYHPPSLNDEFKREFSKYGWKNFSVNCDYPTNYYTAAYCQMQKNKRKGQTPYRDMDFVKDKLGVEVQFGKYSFMVYNVCAKMTIFNKMGVIDAGVEIVPVKQLAEEMSTGVSYFEQFIWDLEHRGSSNIDIPVLILGIDSDLHTKANMDKHQTSLGTLD